MNKTLRGFYPFLSNIFINYDKKEITYNYLPEYNKIANKNNIYSISLFYTILQSYISLFMFSVYFLFIIPAILYQITKSLGFITFSTLLINNLYYILTIPTWFFILLFIGIPLIYILKITPLYKYLIYNIPKLFEYRNKLFNDVERETYIINGKEKRIILSSKLKIGFDYKITGDASKQLKSIKAFHTPKKYYLYIINASLASHHLNVVLDFKKPPKDGKIEMLWY